MKTKMIAGLLCILAGIFILFALRRAPIGQERSPQQSNKPTETQVDKAANVQPLPHALRNNEHELPGSTSSLISMIQQGHGDGAINARDAMEAHLKAWNPVGLSVADLKSVFGPPSIETNDSIIYSFDTGSYAWVYQFELQLGKVIRLKKPLSE